MTFQYCPNYSVPLTAADGDKINPVLVYRARCKQWSCPYCAEINRRVWRARIMLEVQKHEQQWHFWTLTLDGSDHQSNTAQSLMVWRAHWDKLLKRVRRELGKLRYARAFETHKEGTLHVHMLADKTYPDVVCYKETDGRENWRSETLKAALIDLGLGWRHDLKPIVTKDVESDGQARNISAYFVKYLTKEIQSDVRFQLRQAGMGRIRMIQTSQGWANVPTKETDREWRMGGISLNFYDAVRPEGIPVRDVNTERAIRFEDFYGTDHYPNKYSDLAELGDDMQEPIEP